MQQFPDIYIKAFCTGDCIFCCADIARHLHKEFLVFPRVTFFTTTQFEALIGYLIKAKENQDNKFRRTE